MKTILETVVGSTVHGTSVPDGPKDLDLMAVIIEDQEVFCGFKPKDVWTRRSKPDGVRSEAGDTDWVGYGLRKYLNLVLKGNPTSLLALFVPMTHVQEVSPEGIALRLLAPLVASKAAYMPFRGYMRQQHERLLGLRGQKNVTRPELVEAYGYDTKYAGHIIRLGCQGSEFLSTGVITLPMPENERALVVRVRTGGFTLAEVSALISNAESDLDDAYMHSPLPAKPDVRSIEGWMLQTYLNYWSSQHRSHDCSIWP
jgi:hypothetical protein